MGRWRNESPFVIGQQQIAKTRYQTQLVVFAMRSIVRFVLLNPSGIQHLVLGGHTIVRCALKNLELLGGLRNHRNRLNRAGTRSDHANRLPTKGYLLMWPLRGLIQPPFEFFDARYIG